MTESAAPSPLARRWWGKPALLLLTVALLTFSFAPFNQFYLAWVALVPWLIVLRQCRSARAAFLWSWLVGVVFFTTNMWWLVFVTGPGMAALMLCLGLYWGAAGAIIHGARLLEPGRSRWRDEQAQARPIPFDEAIASVFLIAGVWVALEWLRGEWPLGGLAWQFIGHTQSPVLYLCQIADFAGVYGISFWVVLINAWAALAVLNRRELRRLLPACAVVLVVMAAIVGYGFFRFSQHTTTSGPRVLVVQPNYPQSNSGAKGASQQEIIDFHLRATRRALAKHPDVNLVVWSETMMPPLNASARSIAERAGLLLWEQAHEQIAALARQYHVALLTGGMYNENWVERGDEQVPLDRRNSAYLYLPEGQSKLRYDKIHLVPFGEYLPFKKAVPPLYRLFLAMSPYPEEYTLTAGNSDALTVFPLKPGWQFVTPICFEDMDAELVRRMFEPPSPGSKRANFIVNITNDGWFKGNEMSQHLQAAVFRSIENRAPTARSVNTGISGFIDSMGRTSDLIAAGTEGVSVATLNLDSRTTLYTRFGDVFAYLCVTSTALLAPAGVVRWWRRRKKKQRMQI